MAVDPAVLPGLRAGPRSSGRHSPGTATLAETGARPTQVPPVDRLLQTTRVIMSSVTMRRDARTPTGRRAVVLLVALLAHLALMASPLHAATIRGDGAAHATAMSGPTAPVHPEVDRADAGHAGHCLLRWATAPRWPGLILHLAAVPVEGIGGPSTDPPGERPVARALGPPLHGDPQSLLQVFRE
jgi:hypothetical protein